MTGRVGGWAERRELVGGRVWWGWKICVWLGALAYSTLHIYNLSKWSQKKESKSGLKEDHVIIDAEIL